MRTLVLVLVLAALAAMLAGGARQAVDQWQAKHIKPFPAQSVQK
jgi:hypothetical protein